MLLCCCVGDALALRSLPLGLDFMWPFLTAIKQLDVGELYGVLGNMWLGLKVLMCWGHVGIGELGAIHTSHQG